MTNDKYQTCIVDLYDKLKIKEFGFVQFASQDDIVTNAIGLLSYLQDLIVANNFQTQWKWLNIIFKYYSGQEFFNLIMSCSSIAEFADKIEFEARLNAEYKALYPDEKRGLSEIILQEALSVVLLIRILIDDEIPYSAAYIRIGVANNMPFASFELFDEDGLHMDGETKTEFIETCMNKYQESLVN